MGSSFREIQFKSVAILSLLPSSLDENYSIFNREKIPGIRARISVWKLLTHEVLV